MQRVGSPNGTPTIGACSTLWALPPMIASPVLSISDVRSSRPRIVSAQISRLLSPASRAEEPTGLLLLNLYVMLRAHPSPSRFRHKTPPALRMLGGTLALRT